MSVNIYNTENLPVPVKIIVEARSSSRVSLGKKEIIVRLPKHISVPDKEKTLQQFLDWAKRQIREKNYYQAETHVVAHYHGRILNIYGREFRLSVDTISEGRNKLSYRGDETLKIYLLENESEKKQVQEIQRFLLRFTEKYFLQDIQKRTLYWNEHYFKERIEKVCLKHTISCWGSCTANRRISLSTKLLLLPLPVIDYVIVHELAHLKEMNHSPKFWKHVEQAMPDYHKHRKWLQKHGSSVDF